MHHDLKHFRLKKYILATIIQIFILPAYTQYMGGNGDGFEIVQNEFTNLNNQVFYCAGATNDGFYCLISGIFSPASSYCSGGDDDGSCSSSTGVSSMSIPAYCLGGNGDGSENIFIRNPMFNSDAVFSGGVTDGFSCISGGYQNFSLPSVYLSGGNGQGFDVLQIYGNLFDPELYTGGINDGFSALTFSGGLTGMASYCFGGEDDGFALLSIPSTQFGRGIWLGLTNNSWNTASNWKGNAVPDLLTDVFIPPGCLYYPLISTGRLAIASLNGTYFCNSLTIENGGSLYNNRPMYAYGEIRIEGLYQADNNINNTIILFEGSSMSVTSSGLVKIGNQSSGTNGISDLKIDGGKLEITGGTVEVDDQFNLISGDLLMTSGNLFAHKYGRGSVYDNQGPGAFYIAAGTTGNISGGTIKIVGRETRNDSLACKINSPAFDFTGTSVLSFVQGVNSRSDDVEVRVVAGARLNNLMIDAPYRNIIIRSNAVFRGTGNIYPESSLEVYPGKTLVFIADP